MVRVNDKWDIPWQQGMTIRVLLDLCGFSHSHLVVSVGGELVPPDEYENRQVPDGAEVRVVHVIGGGQ